ncbi:MAG TPA: SPOR domain-containing protein [Steroidobacteraceae bacterium]|jgi:cell division protein FtsN
MLINKTVLAICCAVLLGIGGCSRQQSDWQKTREANSTDAYELFLKKYPSGEFSAQAQARLKEMYEERDWQKARDTDTPEAYQAFLKQYPEGKWTEEARIRVENFTLAQTPAGTTGPASGAPGGAASGSAPVGEESAAPPPPAKAPAAPPPSAAPVIPRKPALSASAAPGESGRYAVQLGAFKSGHAAANERWAHLQKEYPKLLGGLSSKVLPRKTAGGTLYRLQAVGLSESHARKICKALRTRSQPCVIVRPAHRHSTSGN